MKRKRPRKTRDRMHSEGAYVCDSCGEEIVIPLDRSAGRDQTYGEDCPDCCCPNVIHVDLSDPDEPRVWAERE